MRIWSLHPTYLDAKGLVALWRETLLAKHVLQGSTKGYKNHPQLTRFKTLERPLDGINQYLAAVHRESLQRGYRFDPKKIDEGYQAQNMTVSAGQMAYEGQHLLAKLEKRDPERHEQLSRTKTWLPHPLFTVVPGEIEKWEIV